MIDDIRNFFRFHLLGKNPLCEECGTEMIQRGHFRDGEFEFKCPEGCDSG